MIFKDWIGITQVWIHGGGWVWGSGGPVTANPDFFMDKVQGTALHTTDILLLEKPSFDAA